MTKLEVAMILNHRKNWELKFIDNPFFNQVWFAVRNKDARLPVWFLFVIENDRYLTGKNMIRFKRAFLKQDNTVYSLGQKSDKDLCYIRLVVGDDMIQFIADVMHVQYYQYKAAMKELKRTLNLFTRPGGNVDILDYLLLPGHYKNNEWIASFNIQNAECLTRLYMKQGNDYCRVHDNRIKKNKLDEIVFFEDDYLSAIVKDTIEQLFKEVLCDDSTRSSVSAGSV